jgi:hypothetical protein
MTTDEYKRLILKAKAEDGARALLRSASELALFAGHFDDISETMILRMVENLKTIAKLKRPKITYRPVPTPDDLT